MVDTKKKFFFEVNNLLEPIGLVFYLLCMLDIDVHEDVLNVPILPYMVVVLVMTFVSILLHNIYSYKNEIMQKKNIFVLYLLISALGKCGAS